MTFNAVEMVFDLILIVQHCLMFSAFDSFLLITWNLEIPRPVLLRASGLFIVALKLLKVTRFPDEVAWYLHVSNQFPLTCIFDAVESVLLYDVFVLLCSVLLRHQKITIGFEWLNDEFYHDFASRIFSHVSNTTAVTLFCWCINLVLETILHFVIQ